MSHKGKLIERVYALSLSQRATLVAFYLINRADQENTCFPSVKTIGKECNVSTRTVQRALNDLEEAGFLMRESRFHLQGGQRSSLYYLIELEEILEQEEDKTEVIAEVAIDRVDQKKIISCHPIPVNEKTNKLRRKAQNINFNLAQITFRKISEGYLSRTPCQDGIP